MATQPTDDLLIWANTDVNLPNLAGPNKTEPSADLVAKGWDFKQKPSADEFNYILNNMGKWINWTITEIKAGTSLNTPNTSTGNSSTANTLQNPRTINGTYFDGSADITTDSWGTSRTFTLTGAITGSVSVDGSANINMTTTDTVSVTNIRLGTRVSFPISSAVGTPQYEAGYVLTGATNDGNLEVDTLYTRPIQQYINGVWYTIRNI